MTLRALKAQLKKLLLARDVSLVDQGVELVRAVNDPALYDELLRGVGWAPGVDGDDLDGASHGTLALRGTYFDGPAVALPFRLRAVLALAVAAPPGCAPAEALKSSITSLRFATKVPGYAIEFDLAPMAALKNLARLAIEGACRCVHASALEHHPSLRSISWEHADTTALPDFATLPKLTALRLSSARGDVTSCVRALWGLERLELRWVSTEPVLSFERFAALRVLVLERVPVCTLSAHGCGSLEELHCNSDVLESIDATGCGALTTLFAYCLCPLREITGFTSLVSLTTLSVRGGGVAWLPTSPAPALDRLTTVSLECYDARDATRVACLPAVERLSLRNSVYLRDLSALASMKSLRELDLRYSMAVADLTPLAELPLTDVHVYYTGGAAAGRAAGAAGRRALALTARRRVRARSTEQPVTRAVEPGARVHVELDARKERDAVLQHAT